MKFLEPIVTNDAAWKRLHRPPLAGTRRLVRSCARLLKHGWVREPGHTLSQQEPGMVPYLEVVWLPNYLLTFKATREHRVRTIEALVEGYERTFSLCDLSDARWMSPEARRYFPPRIREDEARAIARRELLATLLRRALWGRKPAISTGCRTQLVQYPYWVYYFARRRGLLDFRMLDALTGKFAGPKMRAALLAALGEGDRRSEHEASGPGGESAS